MVNIVRHIFVLLLVSGVIHGVYLHWALRVFPAAQRHRRLAYRIAIVLALTPPVARALTHAMRSDAFERFFAVAMMEFMVAGLCAVPIALIELAACASKRRARACAAASIATRESSADAASADAAIASVSEIADETSLKAIAAPVSRRILLERAGGLALLGTTSVALGWGMVRGRHAFQIEEVVVRIPGLPRALDGYTIAQVSDIHVGLFVRERELREGLDLVRSIRPDMVVATGDLIDYDPRYAPMMARALSDLEARDGVFAILGNHDYYTGSDAVRAALAASKIDLLVNAGRRIRPNDGGGFALLGADDLWADHYGGEGPDLDRAIAMVPRDVPRILLSHQPRSFDHFAGQVALQLSGHTHGGQINPIIRPADFLMHYVSGRYERDGSTLWVNRGFGVAGPPARIGAPPEVTKIVLVSA